MYFSVAFCFLLNGQCHSVFGAEVPDDVMDKVCKASANPVYEVEILPAVLAVVLWGSMLKGCQCVFFLDNDAARSALIKGHVPSFSKISDDD